MSPWGRPRLAGAQETVRDVFAQAKRLGRRTGAVMLVDGTGKLCGLSPIATWPGSSSSAATTLSTEPIRDVMTRAAHHRAARDARVSMPSKLCAHARSVNCRWSIRGRPVGLIDITDLIGLVSREEIAETMRAAKVA